MTTSLERLASHYDPKLPDSAMITIPEGNSDLKWLSEAMLVNKASREEWLELADRVRYLHGRGILGVTKEEGDKIVDALRSAALPKPAENTSREKLVRWLEIEATQYSGNVVIYSPANIANILNTFATRLRLAAKPADDGRPDDIRALGWMVAVHNDYRQLGEPHTFWLFTKDGRAVKGEGMSDAEALNKVRAALQSPNTGDGKP